MWRGRRDQALLFFNFLSWPTTTTHATARSSPLSLSRNHGARKITSVRPFSDHSSAPVLTRADRGARDFGHVSRRSHHGHPEQVTTHSKPYHHPLLTAGMLHRILAWPSLLLGLSGWINQHPLRTREGTTPPMGNLMYALGPSCSCDPKSLLSPHRFACTALVASYLPFFIRAGAAAGPKQVPLDT